MSAAEKHIEQTAHDFTDQYIALRRKENRLYSDEQVLQLPCIQPGHPHYAEWMVRKRSCDKLVKHISKMQRPLKILEIGCGNGWLAHRLSLIPGTEVTGFDINRIELQQARRVFHHQANLHFDPKDPLGAMNNKNLFDVIIFAAAIQYFPSLESIINDALQKLKTGGSIHIIDSHFYASKELPAARQRTLEYYGALGFEQLSAHYFHHTLNALKPFNFRILYNPDAAWNKLRRKRSPFHWIEIKKS